MALQYAYLHSPHDSLSSIKQTIQLTTNQPTKQADLQKQAEARNKKQKPKGTLFLKDLLLKIHEIVK